MIGLYIGLSVAALLLILILAVVIRTLAYKPKEKEVAPAAPVSVNGDKAIADLAEMIKCKTISCLDKSLECEEEFDKFKALLPKLFPNVYANCEFTEVGTRGLLYKYKGKSSAENIG